VSRVCCDAGGIHSRIGTSKHFPEIASPQTGWIGKTSRKKSALRQAAMGFAVNRKGSDYWQALQDNPGRFA